MIQTKSAAKNGRNDILNQKSVECTIKENIELQMENGGDLFREVINIIFLQMFQNNECGNRFMR